ncbi:YhfC family intramembrane metalloprotease [Paenibacillus sp. PR3]|uniref:YhfC family intramembrane metalloprotease n=1 Tax=Paenibacillus terricola TaxID=2763503 RepID=A0ABR8N1Q6_9BACL|nr:YhfC family intramembrane metalloprotease [Paenibacillus terricola]MBD3920729.1 YhfC family intramembrane metalloprotease [Paenibacillus terricola]
MNMAVESNELDVQLSKATKRAIKFIPLYVAVPVLFGVGFTLSGYAIDWKAFGLGALGWIIALFLRGPIGAAVMRLPQERMKAIMIACSGILEEMTRVVLLALTSFGSAWALSIGQGWAAVEVSYVIIQIIAISSLAGRTDDKAMQAKQMLEATGNLQASPLWGILERIWASAFHIGCTLIVASFPWMVIALVPLHSGMNWAGVWLATKSIRMSSVAIAIVGITLLITGLTLM